MASLSRPPELLACSQVSTSTSPAVHTSAVVPAKRPRLSEQQQLQLGTEDSCTTALAEIATHFEDPKQHPYLCFDVDLADNVDRLSKVLAPNSKMKRFGPENEDNMVMEMALQLYGFATDRTDAEIFVRALVAGNTTLGKMRKQLARLAVDEGNFIAMSTRRTLVYLLADPKTREEPAEGLALTAQERLKFLKYSPWTWTPKASRVEHAADQLGYPFEIFATKTYSFIYTYVERGPRDAQLADVGLRSILYGVNCPKGYNKGGFMGPVDQTVYLCTFDRPQEQTPCACWVAPEFHAIFGSNQTRLRPSPSLMVPKDLKPGRFDVRMMMEYLWPAELQAFESFRDAMGEAKRAARAADLVELGDDLTFAHVQDDEAAYAEHKRQFAGAIMRPLQYTKVEDLP